MFNLSENLKTKACRSKSPSNLQIFFYDSNRRYRNHVYSILRQIEHSKVKSFDSVLFPFKEKELSAGLIAATYFSY